jgi:hypothetical protein
MAAFAARALTAASVRPLVRLILELLSLRPERRLMDARLKPVLNEPRPTFASGSSHGSFALKSQAPKPIFDVATLRSGT